MTRYSWLTVTTCVVAATSSVALATATAAAWSAAGPLVTQLAFVAGPLFFLALLAWRRRDHPARSRFLLWLALVVAVGGLGILGSDYVRFCNEPPNSHASHAHPLIVPIVQWVVVMAAWIFLVIQEGREERAEKKTA
ncbi:MAG TPA: hypothetical protein VG122_10425 [Gemmata sp.]|nr:hypothetical protein [Gemmata sp.]